MAHDWKKCDITVLQSACLFEAQMKLNLQLQLQLT